MQPVLNPPMTAHRTGEPLDLRRQAADEEAGFDLDLPVADLPLGVDHAEAAQILPGVTLADRLGDRHHGVVPRLVSAVVVLDGLARAVDDPGEVAVQALDEEV